MPTPRKVAMLDEITESMQRSTVAISADYRGLTVAQMTRLRRALRPSGVEVKVVKNTIAAMAADKAGRPEMKQLLNGPSAIAFGAGDPVAPARALTEFIRAERLEITLHGAWLDGRVLGGSEVEGIASLPSKEQLLGNFMSKMQSPLYGFAGLIQAAQRNFAGLIEARANQLESSAA